MFQAYNHENDLSLSKKEQLIELSSVSGLKIFRDLGLVRSWISPSVRSEFAELRTIENHHAVFNNLSL
jgi:hypothetical protein